MKNCMFCGSRRSMSVRADKKGRPYLTCDACATYCFPRGRAGLRMVEVWDQLLSLVPDAKLMEFQLAADSGGGIFALLPRLPAVADQLRAAAAAPVAPAPTSAPTTTGGIA
jgi:hypothetical protein